MEIWKFENEEIKKMIKSNIVRLEIENWIVNIVEQYINAKSSHRNPIFLVVNSSILQYLNFEII